MSVRPVVTAGHPALRTPTRALTPEELASPDVQALIDDLVETMRAANGAGLAANQVAAPHRLCVIEIRGVNPRYPFFPELPLTILANPRITPLGDETLEGYEGCLSVPGMRGLVARHARVRVESRDRHGQRQDLEAHGVAAVVFQHEVDHLDGRLFTDRLVDPRSLVTTESFDRWVRDEWLESVRTAGWPEARIVRL